MALRNTLLVCAAIVAVGGVAGMSMQSHPNGWQSNGWQSNDSRPDYFSSAQPNTPQPSGPVPQSSPSEAQGRSLSLSQIDQPDRLLLRMPVESGSGQRIGEVARVTLDTSGRPREIVLDRGERIAADDLIYLPERSVLVEQTANGQEPAREQRDEPGSYRDRPNGYGPPRDAPNGYGPPSAPPNNNEPPNNYERPNQYGPPRDAPNGYGQPPQQRPDNGGGD